jgi:hypothetical protein
MGGTKFIQALSGLDLGIAAKALLCILKRDIDES